ncbi:glycosyltransferase [Bacteroides uniformis]|uniref:CgeB family protein n=1 Tax=Bacteroides uniformis TaxID=820 RepID=UPI0035615430
MERKLHILSIGGFSGLGESNTCLQRNRILQTFGEVDQVDTTAVPFNLWYRSCNKLFQWGLPISLPDLCGANKQIKEKIHRNKYDIIWIDKGIIINEDSFIAIKKYAPQAKLIGYSPDYMCARHNQTKAFLASLKFYDVYVTTKSYSVDELKILGCKDVYFVGNSYQEGFHRPYVLTADEQKKYGCAVGFIGAWEKERSDSIIYLAENGIKIIIWGSKEWEDICTCHENIEFRGKELLDETYCKAICGCKISLCFLRKINLDLQTTRSVEIPACGSFMLAERTKEHLAMFEEGKEAAYFSSDKELLEKCRYYLTHEEERKQIAAAGHERCTNSGYSNYDRIRAIIDYALNKK